MTPITYNIEPRYTPGSSAMITNEQAGYLAAQERSAYFDALSWSRHPKHVEAVEKGLAWIVWASWEAHGRVYDRCLLTDQLRSRKVEAA